MRPVYFEEGELKLIDQTLLPTKEVVRGYSDYREVADAIVTMVVRGAPAIGVTAGYAVYLASKEFEDLAPETYQEKMDEACTLLRGTRPTAVNLFWAIDRMSGVFKADPAADPKAVSEKLKAEADAICEEDIAMCKAMGKAGAALIKPGSTILTHCNAGALATADYGTALGVIRAAQEAGKNIQVYADETRPLLQGARLTAYELHKDNIPVTLITDNMAGWMMHQGKIDCVVVGADRITRNGDVANKIGTFSVSVLAKAHHIPFYVAAPTSTIDFSMFSGKDITIEQRDPSEVGHFAGVQTAPEGINFENPAFDVTPHDNVSAIITEQGVLFPPFAPAILNLKH
jgi:methylthioribose-1-phosphate isomerase